MTCLDKFLYTDLTLTSCEQPMKPDTRIHVHVETAVITVSGISDTGRVRSENEDSIWVDKDGHFMLIADGMGGHERGEEASQTAVRVIAGYLNPAAVKEKMMDITNVEGVPMEIVALSSLIGDAVDEANSVLYTRNQEAQLKRYMGTTVVGLVNLEGGAMLWFHVGDSRIYRWRDSRLAQLSKDHSAYNEWVDGGRMGDKPSKNIITRAVGPSASSSADVGWEKRQEQDLYILCSDGLSDMVSESEMVKILTQHQDVGAISAQLIDAANEAGGKDNCSVIVCRV